MECKIKIELNLLVFFIFLNFLFNFKLSCSESLCAYVLSQNKNPDLTNYNKYLSLLSQEQKLSEQVDLLSGKNINLNNALAVNKNVSGEQCYNLINSLNNLEKIITIQKKVVQIAKTVLSEKEKIIVLTQQFLAKNSGVNGFSCSCGSSIYGAENNKVSILYNNYGINSGEIYAKLSKKQILKLLTVCFDLLEFIEKNSAEKFLDLNYFYSGISALLEYFFNEKITNFYVSKIFSSINSFGLKKLNNFKSKLNNSINFIKKNNSAAVSNTLINGSTISLNYLSQLISDIIAAPQANKVREFIAAQKSVDGFKLSYGSQLYGANNVNISLLKNNAGIKDPAVYEKLSQKQIFKLLKNCALFLKFINDNSINSNPYDKNSVKSEVVNLNFFYAALNACTSAFLANQKNDYLNSLSCNGFMRFRIFVQSFIKQINSNNIHGYYNSIIVINNLKIFLKIIDNFISPQDIKLLNFINSIPVINNFKFVYSSDIYGKENNALVFLYNNKALSQTIFENCSTSELFYLINNSAIILNFLTQNKLIEMVDLHYFYISLEALLSAFFDKENAKTIKILNSKEVQKIKDSIAILINFISINNATVLLDYKNKQSNVFLNGTVEIINKTKLDFKVQFPTGFKQKKMTIKPNNTKNSANSNLIQLKDFIDVADGNYGAVISFIPILNGVEIVESDFSAEIYGTGFYLSFNVQGENMPGAIYGASGMLSVSRTFPLAFSRAESINIPNFIQAVEPWSVQIIFDTLKNNQIFPRFEKIIKGDKELAINYYLIDWNYSYPNFSDAQKNIVQTIWGDSLNLFKEINIQNKKQQISLLNDFKENNNQVITLSNLSNSLESKTNSKIKKIENFLNQLPAVENFKIVFNLKALGEKNNELVLVYKNKAIDGNYNFQFRNLSILTAVQLLVAFNSCFNFLAKNKYLKLVNLENIFSVLAFILNSLLNSNLSLKEKNEVAKIVQNYLNFIEKNSYLKSYSNIKNFIDSCNALKAKINL